MASCSRTHSCRHWLPCFPEHCHREDLAMAEGRHVLLPGSAVCSWGSRARRRQTLTWEWAMRGFALSLQNWPISKWEAEIRNIIHGCLVEEPGLGPGCCKLCLWSCSRDRHISKKVKEQPSSAIVWDITVSISEISRHEPLLGTKEHLAIPTFSAFMCVLIFFKQSEKWKYSLLSFKIYYSYVRIQTFQGHISPHTAKWNTV